MFVEIIIGLFLFVASLIDIKIREVPNFLSYGLVVFVSFHVIQEAILEKSFEIILSAIYGLAAVSLLGYLLYRLGQWGGGDVKLIFSMGIYYGLQFYKVPSLLKFVILMFFVGGLIGILYSIFAAIKHRKKFLKKAKFYLKDKKIHTIRLTITSSVILMLIISIFFKQTIIYLFLGIAFMLWIGFFLWLMVKSVEEITMIKSREINKLVEGDWLLETVKGKGLVVEPREIGLTKQDLIKLKKIGKKSVIIKEGLPFVPSFFIAYIILFLPIMPF